nr:hypothetical protein [Tanacetum cinerariifolium]
MARRRLGDGGDGGVVEMEVVVRWCGDDECDDGVRRLRRWGEARRLLAEVGRPKVVVGGGAAQEKLERECVWLGGGDDVDGSVVVASDGGDGEGGVEMMKVMMAYGG